MNQNPNPLSPALTTNEDLNGMANRKVLRRLTSIEHITEDEPFDDSETVRDKVAVVAEGAVEESGVIEPSGPGEGDHPRRSASRRLRETLVTFGKFVGPGFMVSKSSKENRSDR